MKAFQNLSQHFRSISKTNKILLLSVLAFLIGFNSYFAILYISLNSYKPLTPKQTEEMVEEYIKQTTDPETLGVTTESLVHDTPFVLLIPKLGLDLGIYEGGLESLEKGIWHRYPERGNPVDGGNFILSGHRFNIGFTPEGIRKASPLYNIDDLELGDEIIVIWEAKVYKYEVTKLYKVEPESTYIEEPKDDAVLTLYTCTLNGGSDGRVVVEAVINTFDI